MYWAKEIAKKIITKHGKKLTLATGISPSGHIHIGNMREITTGELVRHELEKLGAEVRFVYIADDFDRLRKVYPFLPKHFKQYIGWPLSAIPDPEGDKTKTYAERFLEPFLASLEKLGINPEVLSATKLYEGGFYKELVEKSIENKEEIRNILADISGREMPGDWHPYNPLCSECGKIDEAKTIEEDIENHKVKYKCTCGHIGWADYSKAEGKLAWRVDWPARWAKIPVDVEPYGKEHATVGGSYDTGKVICEKIFEKPAPIGIPYDLIYLRGSKGKMSSSLGNVVSASDFLAIAPPEILRYLFARVKPSRSFYLDPGIGLLQTISEYKKLQEKVESGQATEDEKDIFDASQVTEKNAIPSVPFSHLVNSVQAAQGNFEEIKRILSRTGHKEVLKDEKLLKLQIERVQNWLGKFAPENVKFEIQKSIPDVELDSDQKRLLSVLAKDLLDKDWKAEDLHNHIYETGKNIGLKPRQTFESVYLALIGKKSGPKAGWFIDLMDKDFVIKRFQDISK